MPPDGFENRDLLGEALRARDQEIGGQQAQQASGRRRELQSRSLDPVLEKLFTDFAARMPRRMSLPFVRYDPSGTYNAGRWYDRNMVTVYEEAEIGVRGWPIRDKRLSKFGPSKEEDGDWFGLAIDTKGNPWFGTNTSANQHRHVHIRDDDSRVVVEIPPGAFPIRANGKMPGKLKGRDLGRTILEGVRSGVTPIEVETLPELMAEVLAGTIRWQWK